MNKLKVLVDSFVNASNTNGYLFSHGMESEFNLKTNEGFDASSSEVFLHLYEVEPIPITDDLRIDFGGFKIVYFIGMKSLYDDLFYKHTQEGSGSNYRYDKYFLPLFEEMDKLSNQVHFCDGINLSISQVLKRVNYLDMNLDGYLVTANVRVYD